MLELGLDRETIEIYRENADFHTSVSIKSAVVSYIHYRLWPILGRIRLDLYSTEMEGLSWLCSACSRNQAGLFCTCAGSEEFFCEGCIAGHFQKNRGRHHLTYDVAELMYYKIPGYMERREAQMKALPRVREEVGKSVREVDRCIEEYCAKTEELIAGLNRQKAETVELLNRKKGEIEASLGEVEATLAEFQPDLKTVYGEIIREQLDRSTAEFSLFGYELTIAKPETCLTLNIEDSVWKGTRKFPCIYGNMLRLYDIKSKAISSFPLSLSFTYGSVFCLLSANIVLCLGGSPASSSVYQLDLKTQKFTNMPSTNTPRQYPGVAKVKDNVYVFGSYKPNSASCEKLPLPNEPWTNIGTMSEARCCFMPGVYLTDVYLAGLYQVTSRTIEVFSTVNEAFRTLSMLLPSVLSSYIHSFFIGDELFILSGTTHIGKWKVDSVGEMWVSAVYGGGNTLSNCAAFIANKEVLLVQYTRGTLVKVSMVTSLVVP